MTAIMKMISLLLFHLAVSAFGQEELVALNPVLKDHSISYTDPISVRSKYESVATFDPRGMHHVYTITHTFLDLIQRDRILPDSLNASVILDTISKDQLPQLLGDHWQELLLQYIGIVTAAICGLLMAIAIPIAGMYFSSSNGQFTKNKYFYWIFRVLSLLLSVCRQMWSLSRAF